MRPSACRSPRTCCRWKGRSTGGPTTLQIRNARSLTSAMPRICCCPRHSGRSRSRRPSIPSRIDRSATPSQRLLFGRTSQPSTMNRPSFQSPGRCCWDSSSSSCAAPGSGRFPVARYSELRAVCAILSNHPFGRATRQVRSPHAALFHKVPNQMWASKVAAYSPRGVRALRAESNRVGRGGEI